MTDKIDTRPKLETFEGDEERWGVWSDKFLSHLEYHGLRRLITGVETLPTLADADERANLQQGSLPPQSSS